MTIALSVHAFHDVNEDVPCQISGWHEVAVSGLNICVRPLSRRLWVHSVVALLTAKKKLYVAPQLS